MVRSDDLVGSVLLLGRDPDVAFVVVYMSRAIHRFGCGMALKRQFVHSADGIRCRRHRFLNIACFIYGLAGFFFSQFGPLPGQLFTGKIIPVSG